MTTSIDAPPDVVFAIVNDLSTYPEWMGLVHEATPTETTEPDQPAWMITLRAKVGPFARAKKLRMVRVTSDAPIAEPSDLVARFERNEIDGRTHSNWTMTSTVRSLGTGSEVTMALAYDGALWTSALDPILGSSIERATTSLGEVAMRRLTEAE